LDIRDITLNKLIEKYNYIMHDYEQIARKINSASMQAIKRSKLSSYLAYRFITKRINDIDDDLQSFKKYNGFVK